MSKRDLKLYLASLDKEQIEVQLLALYDKFSDVKTYYNFVFHPKEEQLVREAKLKISNEYFPLTTKRAKLRRSTAQKYIKHFLVLGVDPFAVGDVMLFAIEVALKYTAKRDIRYVSYYKSILNSFGQVVNYCIVNGLVGEFKIRLMAVVNEVLIQKWENRFEFERIMEQFDT